MPGLLIPCPKCGKSLRLPDRSLLGRRGKCPNCQHRFVLEEPDEVELELADDAPPVGASARWVPDAGPGSADSGPASVPHGGRNAAEPVASPEAVALPGPAPEPGGEPLAVGFLPPADSGLERLQAIRRRNARRRKVGIATGGAIAVALAGVFLFAKASLTPRERQAAAPRPVAEDREFQSTRRVLEDALASDREAAPTRGEPIRLMYVPAGTGIVLHLRPAELWQDSRRFQEFRYCLGPIAEWAEEAIREQCLFEPAQIEELLVCLIPGVRGTTPELATVVRLVQPQKRSELLLKFGGAPQKEYGSTIYLTREGGLDGRAWWMPEQESGRESSDSVKTVAVGPSALAEEMVAALQYPAPTKTGIEEILRHTDRERHVTLVIDPVDARLHQEFLLPENALDFLNGLLDWFGDEIETVGWSVHLTDREFHSQLLLRNHHTSAQAMLTPMQLEERIRRRIDRLPAELVAAVEKMQPDQAGPRQVIGRFPAMMKVFAMATRGAIGDRLVQLTTVLPERAAPNLALGGLLAWDESTRTDFDLAAAAPRSAEPELPDRVADRLKLPVDVEFNRTPLEDAIRSIGDEVHVPFMLDGDALEAASYTRNMPQTLSMEGAPAVEALWAILQQYPEMCIVVDEENRQAVLTSLPMAAERGQTPFLPAAPSD